MKRKIALIMALSTFISIASVVAEDEIPLTPLVEATPIAISYDDVKDIVLENNKTLMANEYAFELIKNPPAPAVALDTYNFLTDQIYNLTNTLSMLETSDPQYATLTAEIASLEAQQKALGVGEKTSDDDIEDAEEQFQIAEDSIIWATQSLFLSYLDLTLQENDLKTTIASLNNTYAIMQKNYELGNISQVDLLNFEINKAQAESGLLSLQFGKETLLSNLNILLGKDYSENTLLSDEIVIDYDYINSINFEEDLEIAIKNNPNYKKSEDTYELAGELYDSRKSNSNKANLEMSKLNLDAQKQSVSLSFELLYKTIAENQRLYELQIKTTDLALKNQEVAQVKFNQGSISSSDLNAAKDEYNSAVSKLEDSKFTFFSSIEEYKWAKIGIYSTASK